MFMLKWKNLVWGGWGSSTMICLKCYVQLCVTRTRDLAESKALIWWLFGLSTVLKQRGVSSVFNVWRELF